MVDGTNQTFFFKCTAKFSTKGGNFVGARNKIETENQRVSIWLGPKTVLWSTFLPSTLETQVIVPMWEREHAWVQQKVGTEKSEQSGDPSMSTHLVDHLIFLKLSNITKKSVCLCLSYVGKNITQNKVKFQSYACCRLEDKISIWLVVTTCIIWFLRQWLPLGHLAKLMQSCWLQPYHGIIWEIKSKRGSLK